jgi:hypothetical protein
MVKEREWCQPTLDLPILKEKGLRFRELKRLPVKLLSKEESRKNQARGELDPIDKTHLEKMDPAFKAGDPFPMMIVEDKGNHYVIWAGNHRHELCLRYGITHVDVIVIEGDQDPTAIECFSVLSNTRHGKTVNEEVPKQKAYELYRDQNWTSKQAAEYYELNQKVFTNYIRVEKTKERFRQNGKQAMVANLGVGVLYELAAIPNDPTLLATAEYVHEMRLTESETHKLVMIMKTKTSEAAALQHLEKLRKVRETTATSRRQRVIPVDGHVRTPPRKLEKKEARYILEESANLAEKMENAKSYKALQLTDPKHRAEVGYNLWRIMQQAPRLKIEVVPPPTENNSVG